MTNVVLADPDPELREATANLLAARGCKVEQYSDARSLLAARPAEEIAAVVIDVGLLRAGELDVLTHLKSMDPDAEIILLADAGNLEPAAEALRRTASLYLVRPVSPHDLVLAIEKAARRRKDSHSLQGLERIVFEQVLGDSPAMRKIASSVNKVAPTDSTVLLTGESGTGKELLARTIHRLSRRSARAFVAVNCGALPETLLESELFGHAAGAFTGAAKERRGLFEEADRGTLFLDEIGETSAAMQVKLLRVLQDGEMRRVGDARATRVDVRVIAATNRDLAEAVARRIFREDLFYRLNVVHIDLPPLRDRREGLGNMVRIFLARFGRAHGRNVKAVSPEAWAILQGYDYPGNIRELENIVQHAVIMTDGDTIQPAHLPAHLLAHRPAPHSLPAAGADGAYLTLSEIERRHIEETLRRSGGNQSLAAQRLGISRSTLWRKLKEQDVSLPPADR